MVEYQEGKDATADMMFKVAVAAMDHSTSRVAQIAANIAVREVITHLQSLGILDENGYSKLVIRVVNPACYVPFVLEQ